jgi:hypothetical protein
MAECYKSIPITIKGHYFTSLDAACVNYEINRANCLKKAKKRGVALADVIEEECTKVQDFRDLAQDFALGKYTRRIREG